MNRVLYIIIISNRYIKVLKKKKFGAKNHLELVGSSLTTNVDIFVVRDESARLVVVMHSCTCCHQRGSWRWKTPKPKAEWRWNDFIEGGGWWLLTPVSSLVVMVVLLLTLCFWPFLFYFNSWIYLLKRNVIICVIFSILFCKKKFDVAGHYWWE